MSQVHNFREGETLSYFPRKDHAEDNRHFPCIVEKLNNGGRLTVRMYSEESPKGSVKIVSHHRLARQGDLMADLLDLPEPAIEQSPARKRRGP